MFLQPIRFGAVYGPSVNEPTAQEITNAKNRDGNPRGFHALHGLQRGNHAPQRYLIVGMGDLILLDVALEHAGNNRPADADEIFDLLKAKRETFDVLA